ncbi:hypothetical protein LX82_02535 [Celeribacter halophilus]|uniref:Uncharacterized protein n=1 Tax=Celeribacter halophilus TaxID=576117 RepID=A0A1I3U8L5_9RHOB|nr:hypothetical protein LX82_02535 [Celeribacter halophilus]SFJ79262.1 hypothetical protein SAMN04488138_110119 [Celeribacter halophilus]
MKDVVGGDLTIVNVSCSTICVSGFATKFLFVMIFGCVVGCGMPG